MLVGVGARLCCSPTSFSPTERSPFTPKSLRLNPKEAYGKSLCLNPREAYPKSLRVKCVSFDALDARRRELLEGSIPGVVILRAMMTNEKSGRVSLINVSPGFLVSEDGLVMTCAHRISPPRVAGFMRPGTDPRFIEPNVEVAFSDGKIPRAKVEVLTLVRDLGIAVLKVPFLPDFLENHVIRFSKSDAQSGDSCFAIGHPQVEYATRSGVISSPRRYPCEFVANIFENFFPMFTDGFHLMEVDIITNDGFSGGPLLNVEGEAVGMMLGASEDGEVPLAIPAGFCRAVLSYAENKKETDPVEVDGSSLIKVDARGLEAKKWRNRFYG